MKDKLKVSYSEMLKKKSLIKLSKKNIRFLNKSAFMCCLDRAGLIFVITADYISINSGADR